MKHWSDKFTFGIEFLKKNYPERIKRSNGTMKKFCLEVYQIFNASLQPLNTDEHHTNYKVVDQDGNPCVQAHIDEKKKLFILKFVKQ